MALAAVSDIVELVSVPVTGSSEKLEVIPAGIPLTLSPTPPFELLARCSVSPIVPDVRPWVTSIPLPSESSVKLGGGGVEGRVSRDVVDPDRLRMVARVHVHLRHVEVGDVPLIGGVGDAQLHERLPNGDSRGGGLRDLVAVGVVGLQLNLRGVGREAAPSPARCRARRRTR